MSVHATRPQPAAQERTLDLREVGAPVNGAPQVSDRRLYLQLHAFSGCVNPDSLTHAMVQHGAEGVIYLDVNDPQGVGVLLISEDPGWFVAQGRSLLTSQAFASLSRRPTLTMFGRTYSTGREADLEDWLLCRARRAVLNSTWPWAVWYPLRRKSEFALLSREEQ